MKKRSIGLALFLVLALFAAPVASATAPAAVEAVALDVDARTLTVGGRVYMLVDGEQRPLRFEKDGEMIIAFAQTTDGEAEIPVGEGEEALLIVVKAIFAGLADLELTTREKAEALAYGQEQVSVPVPLCPQCQKPLSSGDHSKLPCGHYRCCVEGDHPVVCGYCKKYICNGQDHKTVCKTCGNHVCTKAHRDQCVTKQKQSGAGSKQQESYPGQGQTGAVGSDGSWYNPSYYFKPHHYGALELAVQRQEIKAQMQRILDRIERLENKGGEESKIKELRKELDELESKLRELNG